VAQGAVTVAPGKVVPRAGVVVLAIVLVSLGGASVPGVFGAEGKASLSAPVGKAVVALAPQTTGTVDPALASGASDYVNLEVLYNRLLEPYPDRSELGPGIATKWTVSPDGKTIEFKIRRGVRFHNGDVLTPEDVVFTYQRVRRLGQPIAKAPLERFMESVEARGDSVIFHLKEPDWMALYEFCKPYYSIVPKKYIERVGDEGFLKAPVGTGPFKFVAWAKQEFLEVEAVETEHFLRTPGVKHLRYVIVPEETTRLAMVKTGEADLAQVSVTSLPAIQGDPKIKVIKVPELGGLRIFLFGQADPRNPFSKLEVRQALSLAIDRQAITQRIYHGYARPVAVATANPLQANFPAWGRKAPPYDLDKAKRRPGTREARASSSRSTTTSTPSCRCGRRSPR
jgi:peptide/nickel transport system substrate-binding protein